MTHSRSLLATALLVGFVLAGLATPRDVDATSAKRRKGACASLQSKARARFDRALRVCSSKDADTGRCSRTQWAKYTARLERTGCPIVRREEPGAEAAIARIHSKAASAEDLAVADTEAAEAHLALRRLLARAARVSAGGRAAEMVRLAADLERATQRVATAEEVLGTVERAVWSGFVPHLSLPWLIDEPLRAAMQQLQIETRRLLGPEFHTEISGFSNEPACGGDLIADRLIAAYGEAVVVQQTNPDAATSALGRYAALLACLSARQSDHLDYAFAAAYDLVKTRLKRAGLVRLHDDLARLVAPLQTLLFDVVKLAGDHALAWHWFVSEHDRLRDAVARLGWATNDVVWLYDRFEGRLVGFSSCHDGSFANCIEMPSFLDSLIDPTAIGLGDCALSGMVSSGLRGSGTKSLYACPSTDCGSNTDGGTGTASRPSKGLPSRSDLGSIFGGNASRTGRGGKRLPWTGLSSGDMNAMQQLGCTNGSGGGAGGSNGEDGGAQGPRGGGAADTAACVDTAISSPRGPYGAYVQCIVNAAGRPAGSLTGTVHLGGVPMDPTCGPGVASGGSGSKTKTPGSGSSNSSTTQATTSTMAPTSTTAAPSASPPCVPSGVLDAIQKIMDCGFGPLGKVLTGSVSSPNAATAAGGVVSAELELLKPENGQQIYGAAGAIMNQKVDLACVSGNLSEAMCAKLATMKPGEQAEFLRATGHLKDCADETQCESVCTTTGEQVMQEMHDCQRTLDESLRGDPVTQNDLGSRINPAPDADTGGAPTDPLTSCLLAGAGSGNGGGIDLSCAFVSCADPASKSRASQGSACCGAASPTLGIAVDRIRLEGTCERVQCNEGDAIVADGLGACGCGSGVASGGGDGPPAPAPPSGNRP